MDKEKKNCTCGKSKNLPYCDHSHDHLEESPEEIEIPPCKKVLKIEHEHRTGKLKSPEKILLLMLPYWTPLVPPQGICHLKSFLQHHGYEVKTKDANIEDGFTALYNKYFEVLRKYIPGNKQGNFFNIGHDVMRNHMIAHIHQENETDYLELVKILIYKTYFTHFDNRQVKELGAILDLFYNKLEKYILSLLEKEKPGVLGISVLRDTIGPSMFGFWVTRANYPSIMTVMGGSLFSDHLRIDSPNFEYFLERTPYIDKIIIGEGQNLFLKLLKGDLPESRKVFTLKDIDGKTLGFTSINSPDMTDFNVKVDYPYLSAGASASCPYQCSFCNVSVFYGKYREKDPRQTVEEMTTLYKTYKNQLFFMNDALLNGIAGPLAEEFLKSNVTLYWDGYLRIDDAVSDIENTLLWRRGGLYRVRLGVESGSQHVLDIIGKKISPHQTKDALASLANAGIKTTAYWVIGHPGETEADFLQTLQLLEETKNNIYEAECNPFIFGFNGQSNSHEWSDKRKLLYPPEAKSMLVLQSWVVDSLPTREDIFNRVNRFVARCKELGIPNPYSLNDIYQADIRWQNLHKNAVPCMVDFNSKGAYINECKYIKQVSLLHAKLQDSGDFEF
jgi:radical SAM superfamily enzyme YgiQ (UPF0313 family)